MTYMFSVTQKHWRASPFYISAVCHFLGKMMFYHEWDELAELLC